MAQYFAEVINGEVKRVIVASQDFINSGQLGNKNNWVETFIDKSKRYNYAGIGYTYDKKKDAFIPPKPTTDATFNSETCEWIVPVAVVTSGSEVLDDYS